MVAYATVDEYREQSGDSFSSDSLVQVKLNQQSAKLRAECGITDATELSEDALLLAQFLVIDAVKKGLVSTSIDGIGEVEGVTQTSFTANGFQQSYTLQNPSGSSYWDNRTLADLKRLLGRTMSVGIMAPYYGG